MRMCLGCTLARCAYNDFISKIIFVKCITNYLQIYCVNEIKSSKRHLLVSELNYIYSARVRILRSQISRHGSSSKADASCTAKLIQNTF